MSRKLDQLESLTDSVKLEQPQTACAASVSRACEFGVCYFLLSSQKSNDSGGCKDVCMSVNLSLHSWFGTEEVDCEKKLVVIRSRLGRKSWLWKKVGCQKSREQKGKVLKRLPVLYSGKTRIKVKEKKHRHKSLKSRNKHENER